MNAPRYSTADIAKGAQANERERAEAAERDAQRERAEAAARIREDTKEQQRADAVRRENADRDTTQRADAGPRENAERDMTHRADASQRETAERDAAQRNAAQRASTAARTGAAAGTAAAAAPAASAARTAPATSADTEPAAPLFAQEAAQGFRTRWDTIQASFVDDPRRAVQEADALVAETMQRLADTFAKERARLEQQFDRDSNVSTEDLRMTLRHYRSFFTRLLSV